MLGILKYSIEYFFLFDRFDFYSLISIFLIFGNILILNIYIYIKILYFVLELRYFLLRPGVNIYIIL